MKARAAPASTPQPNPVRVVLKLDHMNPDRVIGCPHYSACLDVAIAEEWGGGFSCGKCALAPLVTR